MIWCSDYDDISDLYFEKIIFMKCGVHNGRVDKGNWVDIW